MATNGYAFGYDPGAEDAGSFDFAAAVEAWKRANPGRIPLGQSFGLVQGDYSGKNYAPGVTDLNSYLNTYQGAGTYGRDDTAGFDYYTPNSGQINQFPEYQPNPDFLDKYGALIIGGIAGAGALAGGLGGVGAAGGLEAAGGAAGALPESYWGMLAESGGAGVPSAAAGTIGGGMDLADIYALIGEAAPVGSLAEMAGAGTGTNFAGAAENSLANYGLSSGVAGGATDAAANSLYSTLGASGGGGSELLNWLSKQGNSNLLSQLLGSGAQGLSSYFASQAQQNSANQANNTLREMYYQNRADLAPWRDAGKTALGQLVGMTTPGQQFTTMQADPGYQFRLQQGQQALDNRQRAAGKFYSGAGLQGAADYNQNFASNEFSNVYNRLAGLAGTGQAATNTTAGLGANTANAVSGNEIGSGNARASGYAGIGNAVNTGINSYNANQNYNQMLDLLKGSTLFR